MRCGHHCGMTAADRPAESLWHAVVRQLSLDELAEPPKPGMLEELRPAPSPPAVDRRQRPQHQRRRLPLTPDAAAPRAPSVGLAP
jgi:hypothetical protein